MTSSHHDKGLTPLSSLWLITVACKRLYTSSEVMKACLWATQFKSKYNMEIIIGVILYLVVVSVFTASGKFLKECDEKIEIMR